MSLYSSIALIVFVIFILFGIVKIMQINTNFTKQTGLNLITVVKLILNGGVSLKETDNRVNIAIFGMPGGIHDGPDLTDMIIIASLNMQKPSVTLLSVPRDIWSDTLKDKINSAYHYGEEKKKGGGIVLASAILEDVTGLPIHYTMTLDFTQFENLIDLLGGVDVNVTVGFTDTEYPIAGLENDLCNGDPKLLCRYETIKFVSGIQHMDGITALKYVRSRHAEGDEGTDFARGRRQQDLIIALKNKVIALKLWFHPTLATRLFHAAETAVDSNMTLGEQLTIGKMTMRLPQSSIKKISIESLLIVPPEWVYGRYVLVPKEDFNAIHTYIKQELL